MNKYTKILKCMNVDSQNLPLDDFQDAEGMVNFYMTKTDEEIDAIYIDYYGDNEEDDARPKMKLLIVGIFEFARDDVEELQDRHLIHSIDIIKYVPANQAMEIGEQYVEDGYGYDSYMVLDDEDLSMIYSPYMLNGDCIEHYWFADSDDGGVVLFDNHMELIVGFDSFEDMAKEYTDIPLVKIKNQYNNEPQIFQWKIYDSSFPYYEAWRYNNPIKAVIEEPVKENEKQLTFDSISDGEHFILLNNEPSATLIKLDNESIEAINNKFNAMYIDSGVLVSIPNTQKVLYS